MRKIAILTLISVLSIAVTSICFAQDNVTADIGGKIGVGFYGGGFFPDNTEYFGETIDNEEAGVYGGSIIWGINRFLALELSVERAKPKVNDTLLNIKSGKCRVIPLTLTAQFRYVEKGPEYYNNIAIYFLGGVGYYFTSFDVSRELKSYWAEQGYNVSIDLDDGFGFHVGVGIEVFLNKNLAFSFEAKRHWADADVKETLTSILNPSYVIVLKDDTDLNFTQVTLGFKLYFNLF